MKKIKFLCETCRKGHNGFKCPMYYLYCACDLCHKEHREKIVNAKSGVPSCNKCGNPNKMYWCYNEECQQYCENTEDATQICRGCKRMVDLDKDYHLDCN